ncbi:CDP-alcohol phosphatidyltransferase family protein [Patescibacteria group bacterium]
MQEFKKISEVKPFQKPQDSIFSTLFTRRLSRVLTFITVKWFPKVTPNQVSAFSFVLSVAACGLFLHPNWWWRLLGVVLLQLGFAFDCSDGELARIKNLSSKYGAWLDSVFDRIKEALILGAMAMWWFWNRESEIWVLLVGFGAIIGLQLVSYLREAKKASWPSDRISEVFITKKIYIGTVDVTIYLVSAAVLLNLQIWALWIFLAVSIPLLLKQFWSAYKLSKREV